MRDVQAMTDSTLIRTPASPCHSIDKNTVILVKTTTVASPAYDVTAPIRTHQSHDVTMINHLADEGVA